MLFFWKLQTKYRRVMQIAMASDLRKIWKNKQPPPQKKEGKIHKLLQLKVKLQVVKLTILIL